MDPRKLMRDGVVKMMVKMVLFVLLMIVVSRGIVLVAYVVPMVKQAKMVHVVHLEQHILVENVVQDRGNWVQYVHRIRVVCLAIV